MDALSAAGSIVGLVELSATVFNAICRFTKDVKDAKAEVGELAKEIRDLSGTLHSLSLLARTLEDQDPFASLQAHRLHACRRTLLKIQDRVYKAQTDFERGRKRDLVLRSIAWPFSKHETQELLDELARHKATISLALSADTMSTLLGILSTQTTLEAGLRDVKKDFRQMFEADTRVKLDQKRQEILQFFSKVNPRIAHQTALSLRQPMTGLWLLDGAKFLDWKATRNSKLWLGGTAGSGKTVLCGGLVDTILQESCPTVAVAYFYCDYKNTASQSPVITLGSIAAQIARQHVTAFDLLQEMYDEHHPKDGLEKPMDATSLCEVIQAMAQNFDRVFIVVDALDECGSQTGDMLESLKTIAECAVVSIALFSRTEQDIRESLADDFSFLEIAAQTQDLEIFVGVEMSRRKGLKDLQIKDPTLNEDVRRKLVHGADGMFRWVACQLDYLSSLPTNSRRRAALQMLPPSLNKTYERILEHVSTTSPDPESRIMIQRALWWIGTASPPLTIPQICEAVSFNDAQTWMDPNDIIEEAAILRSCSSLIRKTHDNQSFEFAHFTVLQYLESISCDSPLRSFRLSQETSSLSLAITSLKFLLLPQFDIYPVAEVSEFDRMDERDTRHPFYMYAASNWFRYTDPRLNDPTPRALVEALFSLERTGNFLSWVVCFSDIRNLDSAGFSVNKYKSLTAILQSNLSPLHLAASLGQPALCQRLIDLKADVNQRSWFGTPLHFALSGPEILSLRSTPAVNKTGDVPGTVGILLERGAQSDALWASYSPLYLALKWCMHYRDAGAVLPLVAHATAYQRDALDLFRLLCDNSGAHQFVYEILSKIISVSTTVKIGEMSAQMEKYVSIAKQFQLSMKQMDPKPISKANFASTICDADFSNALHSAIIHDRDDEFADLIADPRFSKSQTAEFLEFGRTVAHVAAIKSAEKVMKRLIQQGLELDRQDEMGATPMHLCSSDRKLPILKLLLDEKVSSVVQDKNGETVWHLACGFDSPGVMEALLSQDDGVKSKALKIVSREGRTPIAEALYQGNDHLAMEILPHCPKGPEYLVSDVPVLSLSSRSGSEDLLRAVRKQLRSSSTQFPIEDASLLFESAIFRGDLSECQSIFELVGTGLLSITMPSCHACTPLHYALSRERDTGIVHWLLSLRGLPVRPRVNCPQRHVPKGVDPFSCGISHCATCLPLVLNTYMKEGYPWFKDSFNYIHAAVAKDDLDGLKTIVSHVTRNVTFYWDYVRDMIHMIPCPTAAKSEVGIVLAMLFSIPLGPLPEHPMMKRLILGPAKIPGMTSPLHMVCLLKTPNSTMIEYIIQCGANINAQDIFGITPLMLAAREGEIEVVRNLIDNNAGLEIRSKLGMTAAGFAAYNGQTKVLDLLKQRGAELGVNDIAGNNLLLQAACSKNPKTLLFLIDAGLDPHQHSLFSETAIKEVVEGGESHLRSLILNSPSLLHDEDEPINITREMGLAGALNDRRFTKQVLLRLSEPQRRQALGNVVGASTNGFKCGFVCSVIETVIEPKETWILQSLFKMGANPELECPTHGTPILAASAHGRLQAVKFLVRYGARVDYADENGVYKSAVQSAHQHPEVVRWLLVERFTEQPRLVWSPPGEAEEEVKPWAGIVTVEYHINPEDLKGSWESMLEYASRLQTIRRDLRGNVVAARNLVV